VTATAAGAAPAPPPPPIGAGAQALHAARAFPALLRIGLAEVVAYRAEFLVWILTTNMPLVMLALWHAVAADGAVGRFGQHQFTVYYLGVLAVRLLTSNWVAWEMSMQVREGTLAAKLLRPVHPLYAFAAQHLAAVPMRALTITPIVGILIYTAGRDLVGHDLRLAAVLVAALLGAWLLNFFLMVMLGSLAFFIESALGIYELWFAVYSIFSGYLVPLETLRGWVRGAARVLPFRFMLALPVETMAGLLGPGEAARLLAWQWLYVAGAATGALALWRAGVRRFSAYGG